MTYWIGVDDGLMRQVVTEGDLEAGEEAAGVFGELGEGTGTISVTLKLSDFGKPVSIEPPEIAPASP